MNACSNTTKKIMNAVVYPLLVAIFLYGANQVWCRVATNNNFYDLCQAEVESQIHGGNPVFNSRENFSVRPHLNGDTRQTFIGLIATGSYTLEHGAGERGFTCQCACGVFTSQIKVSIN